MSEQPVEDLRPVTLSELAAWMNAPSLATDNDLGEALDSALEWVTEEVGPIESVARQYVVWPSGHSLVLNDDHLEAVTAIEDPDGTVVEVPAKRINLLAGVIEVQPRGRLTAGPWLVTATTREHGASVRQAVKIIASHLYEVKRGRAAAGSAASYLANAQPVGDGTLGRGYAIPRRAEHLLAPFQRARGL
jgi:hypothetical protein